MTRKSFLAQFLGALGAERINWGLETENYISGTVLYELDDPEEFQDFCWHKSEAELPSQQVFSLAKVLREERLLSIDKITVSRGELKKRYEAACGIQMELKEFESVLESLEEIEVPMVDDGEETDIYFIHE
ncbi:hypothetical protein [Marinobacter salexigens]|uniref:Uncharacterized protein n=1 Tax=Marinobacter salexigens TaxID=1925763 RepID=A0ABS6A5L1_9GAMM|nr:hypothetical protein [Marinobacter salexigens]MBU2873456.1 hypothetical protein [Marinobacter salexigens]